MPDVREILAALTIDDQAIWNEHRTCMRKCYLNAVNNTIGMDRFELQDDSFLDLIDIRIALLFDRAGMLNATKEILGTKEGKAIEEKLKNDEDAMKAKNLPTNLGLIDKATGVTGWEENKK